VRSSIEVNRPVHETPFESCLNHESAYVISKLVTCRPKMSDERASRDSPAPNAGRQITLQVGERRFATTRETLIGESGFFTSLLSGRWNSIQEDGSYFIDADGGLFEHVLRYLRRGVLPIFYDKMKGHDYSLYLALLEETKYFQIPRLEEWLEKKQYLYALKIKYSATEIEGTQDLQIPRSTDMESLVEFGEGLNCGTGVRGQVACARRGI
jgi:hypothetical protein